MKVNDHNSVTQHALELARQKWGGKIVGSSLQSLNGHLEGLVNETSNVCLMAGSWHPVIAEPKQQKRAVMEIGSRGLPAYCPMIWIAEKPRRGEIRAAERPMFGSYIFARCEDKDENWHKITGARGVQRVLKTSTGRMGEIHDDAMALIRMREAMTAREFEDQRRRLGLTGIIWDFEPGEVARVACGPFASFHAELTSAVDEHGRINALVNLFGQKVKSSFHAADLEKL